MTAVLVALLQVASCLGLGAAVLRGLGLSGRLAADERAAWAFALGMGILGWLVFWLGLGGLLRPVPLAALLIAGAAGLPLLRAQGPVGPPVRPGPWSMVMLAGLAVAFAGDLIEALAPPSDADSLAYHFATPRLWLEAGRLVFVPRAVDGAIPLLLQAGYVPPLALGGELGLTLWTCLSGWAAPVLLWTALRRHVSAAVALAGALVLATTPAVIYGGGSGQIEIRMAAFCLVMVLAVARSRSEGCGRWAVAAGLMAGFLIGSKYTGLLFAFAAGLVLLWGPRPLWRGAAFAAAAALAGLQWYGWNLAHTGDPLYPMLFGKLPYAAGVWSEDIQRHFASVMPTELPAPRTLGWWLAYPFVATLDGLPIFESRRTGLGPLALLLLPFALAGAWATRERQGHSPLAAVTVFVLTAYSLWFFIPSGQRVRHLLPIYPLLLLAVMVAAARWAEGGRQRMRVLAACLAVTLAFQGAAMALFQANFAMRLVRGESRDAFLARNVGGWDLARWANANLGPGDRLFNPLRTINFHLASPYFYGHHWLQPQVFIGPWADDPRRFLAELQAVAVTHVAAGTEPDGTPLPMLLGKLMGMGCAEEMARIDTATPLSRTLPGLGAQRQEMRVARLTPASAPCRAALAQP